jgi:uncharacterized protein (TIGR02453 family)
MAAQPERRSAMPSADAADAPTTPTFTGFTRDAIDFMAELAINNDRAWFQPRKADYERLVRDPMRALVGALADRFRARDIPLVADPDRSVSRIYRDTRFSKDKSPYKDRAYARLGWAGPGYGVGGYIGFQPGNHYVGGGMWMPEPARVAAFRGAVLIRPDDVRAALEDPGFLAVFGPVTPHDDALKRLPPGVPPDHPLADLTRFKSVTFGHRLADDELFDEALPDRLADDFAAAVPVLRFLASLD